MVATSSIGLQSLALSEFALGGGGGQSSVVKVLIAIDFPHPSLQGLFSAEDFR